MYQIGFTPEAQKQVDDLRERAARSPNTAHAAAWRAIECDLDLLANSDDFVQSPRHRCNRGSVFRTKPAVRARLFYIYSSASRRVTVLMLGFRKAGDKKDAYAELARLLKAGRFDEGFRTWACRSRLPEALVHATAGRLRRGEVRCV